MSETEIVDPFAQSKPKRAYVKKAHAPKDDHIPLPPGPKKTRSRVNTGSTGVLDIPRHIVETLEKNGVSLQWNAVSVRGDDKLVRTELQQFRQQGWSPVTADMFPYRGKPIFEGMWYDASYKGEIEVGGQVLHWRPKKLTDEALAEMAKEAALPIEATMRKVRRGEIDGTDGHVTTQTPKAKAWRQMETTVERAIPVPD